MGSQKVLGLFLEGRMTILMRGQDNLATTIGFDAVRKVPKGGIGDDLLPLLLVLLRARFGGGHGIRGGLESVNIREANGEDEGSPEPKTCAGPSIL
ncbi:hypothetical protein [Salinibacter altiplanensis]|uniref:hypothetical protein n=1 Tax=Salinibacter altiplanensis TaxID=1803181 RepID=UPI001E34CC94|nr:hypothetical protein [Salinibacter altiplanensis]